MFIIITETLAHSNWTISRPLLPEKRPSVQLKWCIAIKYLQRLQYPAQRLPLSRMTYWIIRLVKSRSRSRFMPIGWRVSTSLNNHNVYSGLSVFLYLFSSKIGIFHKFLYRAFWYSRNYTYFYFIKWRYKPRMVLKITNLHIFRSLPTYWLHFPECYTIDNQRRTHTLKPFFTKKLQLFEDFLVNLQILL